MTSQNKCIVILDGDVIIILSNFNFNCKLARNYGVILSGFINVNLLGGIFSIVVFLLMKLLLYACVGEPLVIVK